MSSDPCVDPGRQQERDAILSVQIANQELEGYVPQPPSGGVGCCSVPVLPQQVPSSGPHPSTVVFCFTVVKYT